MKWIRILPRKKENPGRAEARRAVHRSKLAREEVQQKKCEVDETVAMLKRIRLRNHLAEQIRIALEGRR